jgi:hypothetical protein
MRLRIFASVVPGSDESAAASSMTVLAANT